LTAKVAKLLAIDHSWSAVVQTDNRQRNNSSLVLLNKFRRLLNSRHSCLTTDEQVHSKWLDGHDRRLVWVGEAGYMDDVKTQLVEKGFKRWN